MTGTNDEPVRLSDKLDELQQTTASSGDEADEDTLTPEEEQFVAAFVDYWTRRGAQIVSAPA